MKTDPERILFEITVSFPDGVQTTHYGSVPSRNDSEKHTQDLLEYQVLKVLRQIIAGRI